MKVFKYSFKTGKGEPITNVKYSGLGCRIGKLGRYSIHECFSTIEEDKITADKYGEYAICFCTGQLKTGEWEWFIIPNSDLVCRSIERNFERYGTFYYQGE